MINFTLIIREGGDYQGVDFVVRNEFIMYVKAAFMCQGGAPRSNVCCVFFRYHIMYVRFGLNIYFIK